MPDVVVFKVVADDPAEIVPEVNGRSLADLVTRFEQSRAFKPSGGYAGLVPTRFRFGDLKLYYFGLEPTQWPKPGQVWLLGCNCGDVGCWPLEAHVTLTDETVQWSHFLQPHRDDRNYTDFGPFVFERDQYDDAVQDLASTLSSDRAR